VDLQQQEQGVAIVFLRDCSNRVFFHGLGECLDGRTSEAPYVLLQHVGNQNGPAGLAVSNIGQTNAVQIQINEIRAGDRVAIFSELPVSRTDGGSSATYPIGTQSNGKPNDLDYVLDGFESDTNGDSKVTVTVDYWAVDNIRKFRTTSIFLYNKEKRSADLLHSSRELLTK